MINTLKTIGGIIIICIAVPILCVIELFEKKTDDEY